ncbi:MAG TPA: hypothetical protein VHP80_05325, partial [Candidatus Acidoferrum sp.]|nr:hypothetical protein [Candidatus Acidoferrum sp.]
YFPASASESESASNVASKSNEDGAAADTAVTGMYHASRRWESSVLKLIGLFPAPNGQVEVSVEPDNSIRIESFEDAAGQPLKFRRIASMLYEDAQNHQRAAFRRGWDGKMQMQVGAADEVFIQVDALQKKSLNYLVLTVGLGVVVLTLIFWPIGAFVRKHYARPLELSATERSLRITERLVCILFCVLFFGWMAVFVVGLQEFVQIMTGLGRWIILFGIVGIFCSIGTLILWWKVLPAWKGTNVRPWMKIQGTVVALACTALLWFAFLWNLMNFNTHY